MKHPEPGQLEELFRLLSKLTELRGISGRETEVREFIIEQLEPVSDSIRIDPLGNVIAQKKGSSNAKLMIAAHMDEIGLMVRHITEEGFIYFSPIGGWNDAILPALRVRVRSFKGAWVPGVIGVRPPHLLSPEERDKPVKMDKLFIDIGASSREEVEEMGIRKGSPIVLDSSLTRLAGTRVAGKALDDRSGLAAALKAFIDADPGEVSLVFAATSQEEVGLKGATVSSYSVNPDLALAVDVTAANDVPGVDEQDAVAKIGMGPTIKIVDGQSGRGIIVSEEIIDKLVEVAKNSYIPHQVEVLPRGTTDATAIQLSREGIPAGVISIPTRYLHSPVELLDLRDLYYTVELLKAFYAQLEPEWLEVLKKRNR